MVQLGRGLVLLGLVIAAIGLAFILAGRLGIPFGKLPGDITYRRGNFTLFAPLGTSILLSIILSLIFWILSKRR
jgi:hypothetical protein